ncbi:MAG TPA: methionyl-tRNA formyltransferase [Tepidisphaeraceae bacterium]|nr:methionyl-tRNA formyltransferase [Tepidisphaeraceae bacterium]
MPDPLNIIFAGSGEFGAPTLRALVEASDCIVQVYTQPDRPAGRGKKLTPTPIAQLAVELDLPLLRTADINAEALPSADVMVVIAFGQKIGEAAVHHPRLGSVNLHASRLPKYRGAAPINWAMLSGERTTGNSVIRLANKMDAGAILAQSEIPIGDTETAGELHDRLALDGATLLPRVLVELRDGIAHEREQDHTQATMAPKLSRETASIDWTHDAPTITRRINGLSPWPGCRVQLVDPAGAAISKLTLLRARALPAAPHDTPGVLQESGVITAGSGAIEILNVQPDGKRPMSLNDYQRGNRWVAGLRVQSVA